MWVGAFGWLSRKATTVSEAWTMSAGASRATIRQKTHPLESVGTARIYPARGRPPTGRVQRWRESTRDGRQTAHSMAPPMVNATGRYISHEDQLGEMPIQPATMR